jgi:hypothetical protein
MPARHYLWFPELHTYFNVKYGKCVWQHTHTCEQIFSRMKRNKSNFLSRISDMHLHYVLRICVLEMEPNVNSLAEQRRDKSPH